MRPSHLHPPSLSYQLFDAHHQQPLPAVYPGYEFTAPAQMGWDWANSIDFSEFTDHYEPQGELVEELQHAAIANDFSIPLPVDQIYQAPLSPEIVNDTPPTAQTPFSPPLKPPQRPTSLKRKADSEPKSAVSQGTATAAESLSNPAKRPHKSRQSSTTSLPSPVVPEPSDARESPMAQTSVAQRTPEPTPQGDTDNPKNREQRRGTEPQSRVIDVSQSRRVVESPGGLDMLPAGKVFPIQIGSALFRLSGASISSDAPSYFSHFFSEQLHNNGGRAGDVKTLYIDRDPDTFRDIALHLQGYHVTPKNGEQFVKLFADAQFYSLPRLTKQLFSTDIFIRIGGTPFQIPRDLFSAPGDSPNYFSLGFAQFFSTSSDVFPGLDRSALLRPPSISPPSAPSRNGETFAELIRILQGYTPEIRNEAHRSQLLRDARYFHLKGLEQKLIPCEISYNLKRAQSEILLRLEDIRQSGISFSPDKSPSDPDSSSTHGASSTAESPTPSLTNLSSSSARPGTVTYARPYTDDSSATHMLILEISGHESTTLHLLPSQTNSSSTHLTLGATFHNAALARLTALCGVIAAAMRLPPTQPLHLMHPHTDSGVAAQPLGPADSCASEQRVRVRVDADCALSVDGEAAYLCASGRLRREGDGKEVGSEDGNGGRRRETEWIVRRAQWRVRVEPVVDAAEKRMLVVLCGVKIEALTAERRRNVERGFLGRA
ncbi:hypothetical protein BDU57DRAFT_453129 [Ampelomyces quisqualis]|uniref:Potassium channel tetramerisation-type BTB domain-containing protein n=1 Tax=Ampelomyces quisqualis TaxID=50730 RepID=A0A6A5QGM4_AMPQU|nr:hypothetical protein BDU57DRAFT_453129 [Ampelomyces quisqualis]